MTDKEKLEVLKAKIMKLEAENKQYKKALEKHGIKDRHLQIDKEDMVKLFGFRYANGTIADTTNATCITTNYNTFIGNLIRVILPYPRGNKCGWIGYKPLMAMTDFEFEETERLVKSVIQLLLDSKQRIRNGEVEK